MTAGVLHPPSAPESTGPASFRAAAPGSPLFSKSKVILKPGSLSRLTRCSPYFAISDVTLPCLVSPQSFFISLK
jgi:hypothetical protein